MSPSGVEDLPAEVEARLSAIEADLAQDPTEAYAPDDLARAGAWVVLGYDGRTRIERGLVRPEDLVTHADPDEEDDEGERGGEGDDGELDQDGAGGSAQAEEVTEDARAPLSAKLVAELTAHRTAGLRLAVANDPDLALVALTHVLALTTFYAKGSASCLEIRAGSAFLPEHGEGIKTNPAYEAMQTRFDLWAKQMPQDPDEAWAFVVGLDLDSRASLLAFCVGRALNAVKGFGAHRTALAQADALATATGLDMTAFWSPNAERYLARVTKAHVLAAVAEGVSPDTAQRLSGLKKGDLVAAAQDDLVKTKWLPALLRTKASASLEDQPAEDMAGQPEGQDGVQDDHADFERQGEEVLAAAE